MSAADVEAERSAPAAFARGSSSRSCSARRAPEPDRLPPARHLLRRARPTLGTAPPLLRGAGARRRRVDRHGEPDRPPDRRPRQVRARRPRRDARLARRDRRRARARRPLLRQLTHHGPEAFAADTLLPLWGPSAVADPAVREIPKPMSKAEIAEAQDGYRLLRVVCGRGRLRRRRAEGRPRRSAARVPLAVLQPRDRRVRARVGRGQAPLRARDARRRASRDRRVAARHPLLPRRAHPGGYGLDEGVALASRDRRGGLVDYLSADMGTWISVEAQVPPAAVPEGYADEATAAARRATGLPTVAFGRIVSPGHAESLLRAGAADLIGMARQLLADPEWPAKVAEGRADEIRSCVHCNQECVGRLVRELPISCVHNPAAGREERLGVDHARETRRDRGVVVVGGGPAGLKAAETAAPAGTRCVLLERDARARRPGRAAQPPRPVTRSGGDRGRARAAGRAARRRGSPRRRGSAAALGARVPDAVVVATGSAPATGAVRGRPGIDVLHAWTALDGRRASAGERVVVLDLGVRAEGDATVEALRSRGNRVTWVAPTPLGRDRPRPGDACAAPAAARGAPASSGSRRRR